MATLDRRTLLLRWHFEATGRHLGYVKACRDGRLQSLASIHY
jgi:hypothetical protein